MVYTGLTHSKQPWLNPKAGKLMRMANAGLRRRDGIQLSGPNVIEGFRRGYRTIGSGGGWFDPSAETELY